MADRPTRRLTNVGLSMPPAINVDQGKARAWGVTADNLYRMSMQVHDQLDDEAKIDGWRKGMSGDLSNGLMFQPTIRGEAYTQQAIKSYWSNLESTARVRIDQLAAANRNDPVGLQKAIDTYIGEVGGPELPKEFVQRTRDYLTTTSRPYIANARKGLVDARIAQSEADSIMAERDAIMQIDSLSAGMFSSDPSVSASSADAVGAIRARLSSIYSSTVTDDLGNKVPVFSPQAQAKASIALDERVAKGTITGWFQGQRNKIAALRAIRTGAVQSPIVVDGKVVGTYNPMGDLTLEARKSLLSGLRSEYASEVSLRNSLIAAGDRARKKAEDRSVADLIRKAAADPTLDVRGQSAYLLESVEDPSNALQLGKMLISRSFTGDAKDTMGYQLNRINALEGNFDWRNADTQMLGARAIGDLVDINLKAEERIEQDRTGDDGDYTDMKDMIAAVSGAVDYETLVNTRTRNTPKLKQAVRWLGELAQAKFDAEQAGEKFDARAWYAQNVNEVMVGKATAIREARATASEIQTKAMARYTELLRANTPRALINSDPDYRSLLEEKRLADEEVKRLTQ